MMEAQNFMPQVQPSETPAQDNMVISRGSPQPRKVAQSNSAKEREKLARILLVEHKGKIRWQDIRDAIKKKTGVGIAQEYVRGIRLSMGLPGSYVAQVGPEIANRERGKRAWETRRSRGTDIPWNKRGRPPLQDRLSEHAQKDLRKTIGKDPEMEPDPSKNAGALAEAMDLLSKRYGVVELHYVRGKQLRVIREQIVDFGGGD